MKNSRLLFYLFAAALVFVALRPRASWTYLRDLYAARRWMVTTIALLIALYFFYGLWTAWRSGAFGS